MKLSFKFTENDFLALNLELQEHIGDTKRIIKNVRGKLIIVSLIAIAYVFFMSNSIAGNLPFTLFLLIYSIIILIFFFNFPKRLKKIFNKRFKLLYKQPQWSFLKKPMTINITKESLKVIWENAEIQFNWSIITVKESPKYYFIHSIGNSSYIIPKRLLKTKAQKIQLAKLLHPYIHHETIGT